MPGKGRDMTGYANNMLGQYANNMKDQSILQIARVVGVLDFVKTAKYRNTMNDDSDKGKVINGGIEDKKGGLNPNLG